MKRYMSPQKDPQKTLLIIAIGALLMLGGNWLWSMIQPKEGGVSTSAKVERQSEASVSEVEDFVSAQDMLNEEIFEEMFELMADEIAGLSVPEAKEKPVEIVKQTERAWEDNAASAPAPGKAGRVVIIIDDMGMSYTLSNQAIDLPAPITLAFLPYAPNLPAMTGRAKEQGHELMIHMPMEPMNHDLDVGSIALLKDMDAAQIKENLDKAFASFDGYVGINNHMGSRLTQDERAMHLVMNELAARGLLFVDSKTISTSVAGKIAAEHGLDYAERDVFLDHETTPEFVAHALSQLEQIARTKGYAIGIGHPKKATIEGLKKWIPTLAAKNLSIVPVSAVVHHKALPMAAAKVEEKEEAEAMAAKPQQSEERKTDTRFMLTPMPLQ
ncbi:MAG: divergent polysaccharide deacetylase family protein [Alphaproteobacteria bacterium]|nr:divergent polysaccharide deacetylase family protein [Alphaproteobacteria bacterium]